MNAVVRFKNVAPLFVIALSLATATATTTDVIFSFEEDNGEYADTDLETDSAGNIYGTTVLGGDHGSGTVFQLSPTPNGWVQNVLYSFTGGVDGGEPYKGVSIDRQVNLYGTAVTGGSGSCEGGCGVVHRRCRWIERFSWKNVAESWAALWRSDCGWQLWSRSCFRTHTHAGWRMGFHNAVFLSRTTRRKFYVRRVASRFFG
jgi:uncharacterized repeat protein (TIGR03803 family)